MVSFGFSTPGPVGNCGYIGSVSATTLTPTTATLSFAPLVGATSYQLWYHASATGTTASPSVVVTSSPITLTGLVPGTRYQIEMVATCATGGLTSVYSGTFGTTTVDNCGIVTNVTVTATSNSTATVNYTPGNGNTSFNISWTTPGDSTHRAYSTTNSAVLTGLIPGHTYTVQVTSTCGTTGTPTYSSASGTAFSFRGPLATQPALGGRMVTIYPNPAHHAATLVLPAVSGAGQARLMLLNALGQQVQAATVPLATVSETHTQLDLDGIVPGFYTLRIQAGNQSASQRLVVE